MRKNALIFFLFSSFTGQTAPRQPAIPQEEMIVQKQEVPDVPDEEDPNHPHTEVIIGGLQ